MLRSFPTVAEALEAASPDAPLYCLRPHILRQTAAAVVAAFPGEVMYAVKCNDNPYVLRALAEGGIAHWDVASLAEVMTAHALFPGSALSFMHPVKNPDAIAEAYFEHDVRTFALDHVEEMEKIIAACEGATDLQLMVRLATPAAQAQVDLSAKFGVSPRQAAPLLRTCRDRVERCGITFHVGSQCISAAAWTRALEMAVECLDLAKVPIESLDVGGGFPARYRGDEPTFAEISAELGRALQWVTLAGDPAIYCEPGRALVADGMSALVRVELRRDERLFLNDGVYGGLSELKLLGPVFPMRVLRPDGPPPTGEETVFKFYGPTCDSIDTMPGPFWLPSDVRTGDWIEIGMMGAYSNSLRTRFNGFFADRFVEVGDAGPVNEAAPDTMAPAAE